MGCSSSKLDEQEAVKTCHDRRSFVKKAITQRSLLASSHVAYVQSLRRVSLALFYYFAEDEHLYLMQEASSFVHHPASPHHKVFVINCLRPGGAPVHPLEQWEEPDEAAETAIVDRFFGLDHQFFQPSSMDSSANGSAPVSPPPQLPRWDLFWDPFSSLTDNQHRYGNYGVDAVQDDLGGDEYIPELEEESGDDDDFDGRNNCEAEVKVEQVKAAAPVVEPPREERKEEVNHVRNGLRVMANADIEQHGTPGFTVFVDRPPMSVAEAMKHIQGHFMKVVETAGEVSVLLEVVPYQRKVQPPVPREDGGEQGEAVEIPPEPFEVFKSHKESLDRLYEWEKRLYEEVRVREKVRLAYEKKCDLLRSQDANGAEPYAIEKTRVAIRDLRTKLNISLTSVDNVSRRIAAVRDDELLPQLTQLVRALARMWRVITEAHREMKRTADEAAALLSSSRPDTDGGFRGPSPPPGPTRAAAAAGALVAELRSWRAALEAWAESQRAYAAALWGWARSCVEGGEDDMPRLIVAWARAVESIDVEAATRALDAVAAEAAAVVAAAKRQRGGGEEWFNEEEAKKKVCVGVAAALGEIMEAAGMAVVGYDELMLEIDAMERERGTAGRNDETIQN
ncbi:hypothetical protein PR202_ga06615 [Eleusine coracana subsp. coracana]|uniref:Uncharacterized protein n=1 Tax=Eleusine coracana subsp. coracana TaxID=191504 RepID=A0AAV5BVB2_ELECO|nr:hypothetical protein PR202_ga06615 [Eleusine coracana subsp. coracana]